MAIFCLFLGYILAISASTVCSRFFADSDYKDTAQRTRFKVFLKLYMRER